MNQSMNQPMNPIKKPAPVKAEPVKTVTILGATGSIGTQALDVIAKHPDNFTVFALTAGNNTALLLQQCIAFMPQYAVVSETADVKSLVAQFAAHHLPTQLLVGAEALCEVAAASEVTHVVAGIVGGAGLPSIHVAVKAGKVVLLANKESLVMTGEILLAEADKNHATILPLDSEHNALFQCLPIAQGLRRETLSQAGVAKLVLTGSGGPFRELPLDALAHQLPEAACKHPNWSMGRKVSVDSATMMNKGLEYIEAKLLFSAADSQLDVIIHPQSIVHSLVQYKDGTSLAQLGYSDMRVPIAHALAYPARLESGVASIDLTQCQLTFEPVDYQRYPCLQLAIEVANEAALTTILTAANEVVVEAYLNHRVDFGDIHVVVKQTLDTCDTLTIDGIDAVLAQDQLARQQASRLIKQKLN